MILGVLLLLLSVLLSALAIGAVGSHGDQPSDHCRLSYGARGMILLFVALVTGMVGIELVGT